MEVTDCYIRLMSSGPPGRARGRGRLLAFAAIVLDNDLLIWDMKVIDGDKGSFVDFPSRKLTARCDCGCRNPVLAHFCNDCGCELADARPAIMPDGRPRLHADICHPTRTQAREMIQDAVMEAYYDELAASHQPGYEPMRFGPEDRANGRGDGSSGEIPAVRTLHA